MEKGQIFQAGELFYLCSQLSWILKAAIPLEDGLAIISDNLEEKRQREVMQKLRTAVAENLPLSQAMKQADAFPEYLIHMTEIGEKSGRLDSVMLSLAAHYERENQISSQIKSAVTFPLILILMAAAVLAVVTLKILPIFRQVFESLSAENASLSLRAVNMGITAGHVVFVLLIFAGLAMLLAVFAVRTAAGRRLVFSMGKRIPFFSRILNQLDAAEFASALSILLSSGYDVSESMGSLPNLLQNPQNRSNAQQAAQMLEQGAPLSLALRKTGLFTGLHFSMIQVGASAGTLEQAMDQIAAVNTEGALSSINNAVSLIEPALVGIVSLIIGVILLSIMLPLIGVMSSIL